VTDASHNLLPQNLYGVAEDLVPDDTSGFHGLLVQGITTLSTVLSHVEAHMPAHSVHPRDARVHQVLSTSLRTEVENDRKDSADLARGFLDMGKELRAVRVARETECDALEAEKLELRTRAVQFESERLALNAGLDAKSAQVLELKTALDQATQERDQAVLRADLVTQERDAARQQGKPLAKVGFLEAGLELQKRAVDRLTKANKSLQERLSAQLAQVASESAMDTQEPLPPASPAATVSQAPAAAVAPRLSFPDGRFYTSAGSPPLILEVSPKTLEDQTVVNLQTTKGALSALRLFSTLATSELERWDSEVHRKPLAVPPGLALPAFTTAADLLIPGGSGSLTPHAAVELGLATSPGHPLAEPPCPSRGLTDSPASMSQQRAQTIRRERMVTSRLSFRSKSVGNVQSSALGSV
jgi:hypothetical protein